MEENSSNLGKQEDSEPKKFVKNMAPKYARIHSNIGIAARAKIGRKNPVVARRTKSVETDFENIKDAMPKVTKYWAKVSDIQQVLALAKRTRATYKAVLKTIPKTKNPIMEEHLALAREQFAGPVVRKTSSSWSDPFHVINDSLHLAFVQSTASGKTETERQRLWNSYSTRLRLMYLNKIIGTCEQRLIQRTERSFEG
ncbi:MAG: hypothetical protein Q7S21_03935 [archaeon]|nr:hypothetical protein [archaeon]